jgi:hypothetical protein
MGIQYIEFDDDNWAIRQAECHEGRWFNSAEQKYHLELGGISLFDQQLTELGRQRGELIGAEEFDFFWKLSNLKLGATDSGSKEIEGKRSGLNVNKNLTSNRVLVSGNSDFRLDRSPDKQRIDSAEGETDSTL